MTQTLTQLIASVQAQLIDDGTRFSTATLTASIRSTLSKMNKRIPQRAADLMDIVTAQLDYEVTDIAPTALAVLDVLLNDADGDHHTPIHYNAYTEDERLWVRLETAWSDSEDLLIRYTKPHTVNGLNSETVSTLTADQDQILVDGACAAALAFRAASRVETINLQQQVSDNYREAMIAFQNAYEMGIQFYERRASAPSPKRQDAWNDEFHGWAV